MVRRGDPSVSSHSTRPAHLGRWPLRARSLQCSSSCTYYRRLAALTYSADAIGIHACIRFNQDSILFYWSSPQHCIASPRGLAHCHVGTPSVDLLFPAYASPFSVIFLSWISDVNIPNYQLFATHDFVDHFADLDERRRRSFKRPAKGHVTP